MHPATTHEVHVVRHYCDVLLHDQIAVLAALVQLVAVERIDGTVPRVNRLVPQPYHASTVLSRSRQPSTVLSRSRQPSCPAAVNRLVPLVAPGHAIGHLTHADRRDDDLLRCVFEVRSEIRGGAACVTVVSRMQVSRLVRPSWLNNNNRMSRRRESPLSQQGGITLRTPRPARPAGHARVRRWKI